MAGILGPDGRPISSRSSITTRPGFSSLWGLPQALPSTQPFEHQGTPGTAVWGGYVQVKETSPKWVGREKYRTASDLAVNTSVVAAGVHYFLNLIAHPKWKCKPADEDDPEAVEYAKFMDYVLNNMDIPWQSVVRTLGMFRFHGFSIHEWVARRITTGRWAGQIGLEAIEQRPQWTIEQWAVDDNGKVLGAYQRNPQNGQLFGIPRSKMVYVVEDLFTDSPEGLGVFRHLGEPWLRLKRFMDLEVRAYERDLRGTPIGRAPITAINQAVKNNQLTQAQANELISGIKALLQTQVKQSDTAILLDSQRFMSTTAGGPVVSDAAMWSLELLSGPGLGLVEIAAAIDRVQREMARIIGVEHLMLGDNGGSRAVAQDKSRNIYLIADTVLRAIKAAAARDVVNTIWRMNAIPQKYKPTAESEDISPMDVIEITTALARMAQSGAVLDPADPVINDLRDMLGVSRQKAVDPLQGLADPNAPIQLLSDEPMDLLQMDQGDPTATGEASTGRTGKPTQTNPEFQRLPRSTALTSSAEAGTMRKRKGWQRKEEPELRPEKIYRLPPNKKPRKPKLRPDQLIAATNMGKLGKAAVVYGRGTVNGEHHAPGIWEGPTRKKPFGGPTQLEQNRARQRARRQSQLNGSAKLKRGKH